MEIKEMNDTIVLLDTDARAVVKRLEEIKVFLNEARVPLKSAAILRHDTAGQLSKEYWRLLNVSDNCLSRVKRSVLRLLEEIDYALCGEDLTKEVQYAYSDLRSDAKWILFDEIRRSWSASTPATSYALAGSAVTIVNNLLKKLEEANGLHAGMLGSLNTGEEN